MAKVSREYAKALFASIENAEDRKAVLNFLRGLSSAFSTNAILSEKLKSKSLNTEDAKKLFSSLSEQTQQPEVIKNFLNLLIDKKRLNCIPEIASEYEQAVDQENNVVRGLVKSANLITPEERAELEEKFSKQLNKKVVLTYEQDAKVMAGLKVEVGAYTFDDTIETHIKNIKENLNRSWN